MEDVVDDTKKLEPTEGEGPAGAEVPKEEKVELVIRGKSGAGTNGAPLDNAGAECDNSLQDTVHGSMNTHQEYRPDSNNLRLEDDSNSTLYNAHVTTDISEPEPNSLPLDVPESTSTSQDVLESANASQEDSEEFSIRRKSHTLKQKQSSLRRRQIDDYRTLMLKEERKLRYLKRHPEFTDEEEDFRSPSSLPRKKVSFKPPEKDS